MSTELSGSPGEYHKPAVVGHQNRMDNNPNNQADNKFLKMELNGVQSCNCNT